MLAELVSGDSRVALALPKSLSGGRHFVDLRLMQGGKVHDWMSFALESEAPVEIVGLAPETDPGTKTVIGPGVRVEGDLKSPSGVELLGTVEGSFEVAGLLIVRESGRVIGDVTAQDVIVQGAVEGRVIAAQRIELGASGRIQGDLQAKAVSIAEGAYFEGKVQMAAST